MDRKEIKKLAKEKVKGNKWNILWPLIVISVINSVLNSLFGPNIDVYQIQETGKYSISTGSTVGSILITIVVAVLTAGYLKYLLTYVRTGKFNSDEIIKTIKAKWLDLLIASALSTVIIALCSMLLVIPGIIAALALAMVMFLVIDKDVKGHESLKASKDMMKGYKWNYFVFQLSFIGWYILVPFTLGILLIWLIPYVNVAKVIYYDKLSAKKN